jgi:hypothetical protein
MPMKAAIQEGSVLMAQSRAGIAATVIQSTAASRPMRAANRWPTIVENVLLTRPSSAAARQFDFGIDMTVTKDLRILRSICRGCQKA